MINIQDFPYTVEVDENGIYIVSCSTFVGCHAAGVNLDEALNNLIEVIELCLEE